MCQMKTPHYKQISLVRHERTFRAAGPQVLEKAGIPLARINDSNRGRLETSVLYSNRSLVFQRRRILRKARCPSSSPFASTRCSPHPPDSKRSALCLWLAISQCLLLQIYRPSQPGNILKKSGHASIEIDNALLSGEVITTSNRRAATLSLIRKAYRSDVGRVIAGTHAAKITRETIAIRFFFDALIGHSP